MRYYIGTIPISDDLYHHGIKGQKWGVRRYQNLDRTLTAAGKLRYAAQKTGQALGRAGKAVGQGVARAGRATGKAIKTVASHRVQKFKEKHLWMMSKDELNAYKDRLLAEKSVKDAKNSASYSRGKELAKTILENGAKTLANKAFEAIGNKALADQRLKDDMKYMSKMSKQAAKNKLKIDRIIDKGQKKQTKKDPSEILAREIKKNYKTMSDNEFNRKMGQYEKLKQLENRYRGATIQYPSVKKG